MTDTLITVENVSKKFCRRLKLEPQDKPRKKAEHIFLQEEQPCH